MAPTELPKLGPESPARNVQQLKKGMNAPWMPWMPGDYSNGNGIINGNGVMNIING
jgi:hypothetical protein